MTRKWKLSFSNRQYVNFAKVLIDIGMLFSIKEVYFPNNFVYTKKNFLFLFSIGNLIMFDLYISMLFLEKTFSLFLLLVCYADVIDTLSQELIISFVCFTSRKERGENWKVISSSWSCVSQWRCWKPSNVFFCLKKKRWRVTVHLTDLYRFILNRQEQQQQEKRSSSLNKLCKWRTI